LYGLDHPEVALLAAMGAAGTQRGNIARDLHHFLGKGCKLPKPFELKVPCVEPHSLNYTIEDGWIHLPHMMFAALADYTDFEAMFNPGQCQNFWDSVKPDDPNICKQPVLQSPPGWNSACMPCYIHGDGVEFEKDNSLLVFSWGSLLATGSSMETSVLMVAWPKDCTAKTDTHHLGTWDAIHKWICWSLRACFQ
jgi:hypothetical protein